MKVGDKVQLRRRISQKGGKTRLATEKVTILGTFPGNDIGKGDRVYILDEDSTEEKAIKAMEMCREKYLSRMELDGGYDIVNGCYVQPNYWVLPKVFQFLTDQEV